MKKRPGRRKHDLAIRFERAVRQLPGRDRRWLLERLRTPRSGTIERDFYVLDVESGRWVRL
jgi:hypothetical protein